MCVCVCVCVNRTRIYSTHRSIMRFQLHTYTTNVLLAIIVMHIRLLYRSNTNYQQETFSLELHSLHLKMPIILINGTVLIDENSRWPFLDESIVCFMCTFYLTVFINVIFVCSSELWSISCTLSHLYFPLQCIVILQGLVESGLSFQWVMWIMAC